MIYTVRTRPHTTDRKPTGINALFGDMHISFSATKKAFDPKLWDPGHNHRSAQIPAITPKNSELSWDCYARSADRSLQ